MKSEDACSREQKDQRRRIVVHKSFSPPEPGDTLLDGLGHLGAGSDTSKAAPALKANDVLEGHGCSLVLDEYEAPFFTHDRARVDAIAACQASLVTGDVLVMVDPIVGLDPLGEKAHPCHRAVILVQHPTQVDRF